jgi:hypothetical protein
MKTCERAFEEIGEMIKEIGRIHFESCGTIPLIGHSSIFLQK